MIGKVKIVLVTFALLLGATAQAQTAKYSNEFLAIGVGARSLAMSNSSVASVQDVTSGYWNPAGLVGVKSDMQVGLMHAEYFAGIAKYDYAGIAKPLDDKSTIAFSMIRFGVDDIPNTTELIDQEGNWDYSRITGFSAIDYAFIVSYARRDMFKEGLDIGANLKIIHRKVGDFATSWGFGIDAGARYKIGEWQLGAVVRDATTTFNAWNFTLNDRTREVFALTNNEIPENSLELTLPRLILAGARTFTIGEKFSLLTELDLDLTFDGKRNTLIFSNPMSIDPHMGLEFGFKNIAFLRGGIGNIQRVTDLDGEKSLNIQPNMGLGIKIKGIELDYALTDIGDASVALYSNVFSLKFDLYKKTTE